MIHAQNQKLEVMLAPQAVSNGATATANLDVKGADYATIILSFAAEKNTNAVGPALSLLESDDTTATNFATFDSNFTRATEDLTESKQVVYHVDTRARKRYLRLSVTPATSTNDTLTICAEALVARLSEDPASTSDMVASTNDKVVIG